MRSCVSALNAMAGLSVACTDVNVSVALTSQHRLEGLELIVFRAAEELYSCFEVFYVLEFPLPELPLGYPVLHLSRRSHPVLPPCTARFVGRGRAAPVSLSFTLPTTTTSALLAAPL